MDATFWHKQTADKPLFPDLLWSRPENRQAAGKLLVVGGNKHGFAAVATAFAAAQAAGIGSLRLLLPDSLKRTVGTSLTEAEFAPSTPSGSFSRQALSPLLELADWADGILLAGDFGHNSETAVLLENFLDKYDGRPVLTGDSLDYFIDNNEAARYNLVITTEFSRLQKLFKTITLKHDEDLMTFVGKLHDLSQVSKASVVTFHAGQIVVATDGQICTTPANKVEPVSAAAYVATWLVQQPQKPFNAMALAIYDFVNQASLETEWVEDVFVKPNGEGEGQHKPTKSQE